jgi:hypothetical protein
MPRNAQAAGTTAAVGITLDDGRTLLSLAESLVPPYAAYWIWISLRVAALLVLLWLLLKSMPAALAILATVLKVGARILGASGNICGRAARGLRRALVNGPSAVSHKAKVLGRDVARALSDRFGRASEIFGRMAGPKPRRPK